MSQTLPGMTLQSSVRSGSFVEFISPEAETRLRRRVPAADFGFA
jgi:hypothetical protein